MLTLNVAHFATNAAPTLLEHRLQLSDGGFEVADAQAESCEGLGGVVGKRESR